MNDEMVLVPKSLLSCDTAGGLDVQDVLDIMTGADWHSGSGSYVPQTAAEHRSQVIQELIEKALGDAAEICQERYLPDERAKVLRYLSEWLKSQMEGE